MSYEESEMKLKMKALQSRLQGHGGLKSVVEKLRKDNDRRRENDRRESQDRRSEEDRRTNKDRRDGQDRRDDVDRRSFEDRRSATDRRSEEDQGGPQLTPDTLEQTFSYLKNLSSYLPDQETGLALDNKMRDILSKLKRGS